MVRTQDGQFIAENIAGLGLSCEQLLAGAADAAGAVNDIGKIGVQRKLQDQTVGRGRGGQGWTAIGAHRDAPAQGRLYGSRVG